MRLSYCLCLLMFCGPLAAMTADDPTQPGGAPGQAQVPSAQSTPAPQTPHPAAAPTPQASATTVPANMAATTTPASGAAPPPSNKPNERTADENLLLSRGYHREVHDGQTTYCRREVTLGSRFEKKVCGSVERLIELIRLSREETDRTMRQGIGQQPSAAQELAGH